jgi:hypothetical protein
VLTPKFTARVTDWRIPDYLCLIHPRPSLVIPASELRHLYMIVRNSESDFVKLFAHFDSHPLFTEPEF